jgi:hypothetical protein
MTNPKVRNFCPHTIPEIDLKELYQGPEGNSCFQHGGQE